MLAQNCKNPAKEIWNWFNKKKIAKKVLKTPKPKTEDKILEKSKFHSKNGYDLIDSLSNPFGIIVGEMQLLSEL